MNTHVYNLCKSIFTRATDPVHLQLVNLPDPDPYYFIEDWKKFPTRIRPDPELIGDSAPDILFRFIYGSADPDPKEIFTNPEHYFHTIRSNYMSRVLNVIRICNIWETLCL